MSWQHTSMPRDNRDFATPMECCESMQGCLIAVMSLQYCFHPLPKLAWLVWFLLHKRQFYFDILTPKDMLNRISKTLLEKLLCLNTSSSRNLELYDIYPFNSPRFRRYLMYLHNITDFASMAWLERTVKISGFNFQSFLRCCHLSNFKMLKLNAESR